MMKSNTLQYYNAIVLRETVRVLEEAVRVSIEAWGLL
jgi:hypothetical protein